MNKQDKVQIGIKISSENAKKFQRIARHSSIYFKNINQSTILDGLIGTFLDFADSINWNDSRQVEEFWSEKKTIKLTRESVGNSNGATNAYHSDASKNILISQRLEEIAKQLKTADKEGVWTEQDVIYLASELFDCYTNELVEALEQGKTIQIIVVPLDKSEEVEKLQEENEKLKQEISLLEKLNDKKMGVDDSFWANLSNEVAA